MKIEALPLSGAFRIELSKFSDERGFFARTFCRKEFLSHGLADCSEQVSLSYNAKFGTLRGMHFQLPPFAETKLVRCSRGRIFDVIVDIRPESSTYGQYYSEELSAENSVMLYIPHGFAHGFLTLEDDTEVDYQMAEAYVPGKAQGFAWNDPEIKIAWPTNPSIIGENDRNLPGLSNFEQQL